MKKIQLIFTYIILLSLLTFIVIPASSCRIDNIQENQQDNSEIESASEVSDNIEEDISISEGKDSSKIEDNTSGSTDENEIEDDLNLEDSKESIDKEKAKMEIPEQLLNFFEAIKEENEYNYFSSYTKLMVGSTEEYTSGKNSDIYFMIHENYSSWKNIELKKIFLYRERAIIEVSGSRTVEGIDSNDELLRFKFINEEDIWKIDFYYPLLSEIKPITPEPDSISAYEGLLVIEFEAISFFPIRDIELFLNDVQYNADDIKYDSKYELRFIKKMPSYNAYRSINDIRVKIINRFNQEDLHSWSFVLG